MKQKISILSTLLFLLLRSSLFAQIPTIGLVAHYPFNGNANDISGNGNNGIVNGATLCPDRFGNANSAYSFDGAGNYIEVTNSSTLNVPNSITLVSWFKTTDPYIIANPEGGYLIAKAKNVGNRSYDMMAKWSGNDSIGFVIFGQGDIVGNEKSYMVTCHGQNYYDNLWHFVVGTYDYSSGYSKIYIDGILKSSAFIGQKDLQQTNEPLTIGCYLSTNPTKRGFFNGSMDDIRIYNRALDQCEIIYLYNENCTTAQPVASNITICGSGTGNIVVNSGSDFNKWYDSPLGCTAIDSGTIFTTPYIVATDTFYVSNTVGCESSRDTVIAFVRPLPSVSLGSFSSVCIDASPFALSGGSPGGGTYSGPGIVNDSLHPFIAGPATHNITYHFTDSNSCTDSSSNTIIVNDLPAVTLNNFSMVCEYTPSFTLSGGSPIGGIYSGTGINLGTFDPAIAGAGTYPIVYHYTDGNNCSNSDTASILVSNCTGVNEIDPASILEINPNPNSGRFTITIIQPESGSVQLQITNAIGQLIKEETFETTSGQNSHIIDLGEIVSGTYFLTVFDGVNSFKKVIVVN